MAFTDKRRKNEYNEGYRREHYDRYTLRLRKGHKELVESAAKSVGEPMSIYIKRSIAARLESDGVAVPEDF